MLVYPINVRQSAATAAGAIVWGLYNPSAARTVYVRALQLQMFFDGTAAASQMKYELVKYTGVTAFSGGVAAPPMFRRTSQAGGVVSQARVLDTGLTATNGTASNPIPVGTMGRVTVTTTNFQAVFSEPFVTPGEIARMEAIELATNELLAIRQSVVSVIGDNIVGYAEALEI